MYPLRTINNQIRMKNVSGSPSPQICWKSQSKLQIRYNSRTAPSLKYVSTSNQKLSSVGMASADLLSWITPPTGNGCGKRSRQIHLIWRAQRSHMSPTQIPFPLLSFDLYPIWQAVDPAKMKFPLSSC